MTHMGVLRAMRSRLKQRNSEALNDKFSEGVRYSQDNCKCGHCVCVQRSKEDMLPRGKIKSCEGKKAYAKMVQCLNEFEQEMPGLDPLDFVEDTQTHDR